MPAIDGSAGRGRELAGYAVGLDVGGTKIAAGVVDGEGRILSRVVLPCPSEGPPGEVVSAIVEAFRSAVSRSPVDLAQVVGVGLGIAGHVNGPAGVVLTSSNLSGWDDIPLRQIVKDRTALPVFLDNDANCAALAEHRFGAGRGTRHMCYVTISTGCGMGIIVDGKLYVGANGTAGELGHTVVEANGELCACGKRGCVMAYACGMAVSRMARERLEAGAPSVLRDLLVGPTPITCEDVAIAALRGDSLARELVETCGRYLGIALSTVVQLLNPEVIVLGGGLTRIGAMLLDPCARSLRENVHSVLADSCRLAPSQLGGDAGMVGAAALVWERLEPSTRAGARAGA